MRTRAPLLRLFLFLSLVIAACSVIVNPSEGPELCEPDGPSCGEGLICANVEGDYRCIPGSTCTDDPTICVPPRPHCRPDGECVECVEDAHCELGFYCLDETWCQRGCNNDNTRCPEGHQCIDQQCVEPREEVCNGHDDDLDGIIDNGLDNDGDGYSDCPTSPNPGDCNDTSASARPGGTEVCDGLDNDCDGFADNGDLCRDGWVCASTRGCVEIVEEGCEDDSECTISPNLFCNTETGECLPSASFGEPCFKDQQCIVPYRCLDTTLLGQPGFHCTELCCNDGNCPPASFCAESGNGLRVCAAPGWFDSDTVQCQIINRCGTCAIGFLREECVEQCCRDSDCDETCQIAGARSPGTGGRSAAHRVCDFWEDGLVGYEDCEAEGHEACYSGIAWTDASDTLCRCAALCCSDADCRTPGHEDALCIMVTPPYSACYDPDIWGGSGVLGELAFGESTCHEFSDCASGVCHRDGYCSQMCCPGGGGCPTDYECRPVQIGGVVANICTYVGDGTTTHK